MWPDSELLTLLGIELPLIQAPMAGANEVDMVVAVSNAGGLGSLPCAMLDCATADTAMSAIRQRTDKPYNVNFFCHTPVMADPDADARWRIRLRDYYIELGLDPAVPSAAASRQPFDEQMCDVVEKHQPAVVSFHFGLPDDVLLARVKAAGCKVLSSATTVAEARWLAEHGCDVIIAQGYEAGGHRGTFLSADIAAQPGTMALIPQVVDAVDVPVIAAGGIADGRGIVAAMALGAVAVQLGTVYLYTPEATISSLHRQALDNAQDVSSVLTNVFSGRPARGIMNRLMREAGPLSDDVPSFPHASGALAPLKAQAERNGSGDFSSLWAGQAAAMKHALNAHTLTRRLASDAAAQLRAMAGSG